MVNPDGGEWDLADGGSACPVDGFRCWRKNRQPNADSSYIGTDLNRNYGYRWGCCGGSSGSTSSDTYRGPAGFSSPETAAMRDFLASRTIDGVNQIRAHITFHAAGEQILWPYGYTYADRPSDMTVDDHGVFVAMAEAMAATNGYSAQQSSDLYPTDGDQIDWLYGVHKVFSYTFEMYPALVPGYSRFYPPDDVIERETKRNHEAVLYLLERARCPYRVLSAARAATHCGPFGDDFEIHRGAVVDAEGQDTATAGRWERGTVAGVVHQGGTKQPAGAASGRAALVTGRTAGADASDGDLDGRTSVLLRPFTLKAGIAYRLGFKGYLAHDGNSSGADFLRITLVPESGPLQKLYQLTGRAVSVNAAWTPHSASFTVPEDGTYRLRVVAADGAPGGIVEAGVDDLYIARD
jgi:hypothetical protein